ncbi:glycosyl hydrolase family 95 catalytic domain-containing protein [Paenibacillus radicis (ex Xue et al. 2023)]|uniref:Alpha-L-fucosidase n=1 Tax=Paenibacillus radicis (ex Xue et al. 2023) TaxID=2972489 RepID=A0ABT1YIL8_9BACL|nr:hypothetical protein [Paenibacillus radicis (ex Xue et al. 2023)]MCR8633016.1 hypothetical protein [Paenibacillus radicis (ex Xue et al. 2023)]
MGPANVKLNVDWPQFLAKHDLIWDRCPEKWEDSPYLGNGLMGAMLFKEPGKAAWHLEIYRSDVQDHRDDSHGSPGFSRARLPIGHFLLFFEGNVTGCQMRLELWNAELNGTIFTDKGQVDIKAIVHSEELAILVETKPDSGEKNCFWQWFAAEAVSPRQSYGLRHGDSTRTMASYSPNPRSLFRQEEAISLSVQPLSAGGQTATAWIEKTTDDRRLLIVSVAHSYPQEIADKDAWATVKQVAAIASESLWESHRHSWHEYYPLSFVSFSDTQLESFYWIQMYKLFSATRADRALIDNQGPWLDETPWPYATWNLNVQLSYWPLFASNRLPLAQSLWRALHSGLDSLISNVAEPYRHDSAGIPTSTALDLLAPVVVPGTVKSGFAEAGNLTWALHDCWLYYRMTMDDSYLEEVLYPLLRRSINYYLHFLYEDEEQRLHLLATSSPEYGAVMEDCNYDLSLLRWGCEALIYSCKRLGIRDELLARWGEVLEKLTEYPENDSEGFLIGRDQSYEKSHRHYSHLLMIYPLYLIHAEQPGNRERIEKSLLHWQSKPEYLEGYSCTGSASISAGLGDGDRALAYLKRLWEGFLSPTTMYRELGPVIETPLSAAQSIHDMLLQSWGNTIRVFPAVPEAWKDAAIHDMCAEGGFLVSAVRKEGVTQFVRIKSLAGEPCLLRTGISESYQVVTGSKAQIEPIGEGLIRLQLLKGEEIVFALGHGPEWTVDPCAPTAEAVNSYGLNARTRIERKHGRNPEL